MYNYYTHMSTDTIQLYSIFEEACQPSCKYSDIFENLGRGVFFPSRVTGPMVKEVVTSYVDVNGTGRFLKDNGFSDTTVFSAYRRVQVINRLYDLFIEKLMKLKVYSATQGLYDEIEEELAFMDKTLNEYSKHDDDTKLLLQHRSRKLLRKILHKLQDGYKFVGNEEVQQSLNLGL